MDIESFKKRLSDEIDKTGEIEKYVPMLKDMDNEDISLFLLDKVRTNASETLIKNLQKIGIPDDLILEELAHFFKWIPASKLESIVTYQKGSINLFDNVDIFIDGIGLGDYLLKISLPLAILYINKGAPVSDFQLMVNNAILKSDKKMFDFGMKKWNNGAYIPAGMLSISLWHPLSLAIKEFNYDFIEVLIRRVSPNGASVGPSPLHQAIMNDDLSLVEQLVDKGALFNDIKLSDASSNDIVQYLLDKGVKGTAQDIQSFYPHGLDLVQRILKRGNIEHDDPILRNVLLHGIKDKRIPWVKDLLEYIPLMEDIAYLLFRKNMYNLIPFETKELAEWELYCIGDDNIDKVMNIAREAGINGYSSMDRKQICHALHEQMMNLPNLVIKYKGRESCHNFDTGTLSGSNLEDVPPEYLVRIIENGNPYCFEIADIPHLLKERVNPYNRVPLSPHSLKILDEKLQRFIKNDIPLSFPDLSAIHMRLPRKIRKGNLLVDDIAKLVYNLKEKGLDDEFMNNILDLSMVDLITYIMDTEFIFEFRGTYRFSPGDIQHVIKYRNNPIRMRQEILHILDTATLMVR